MAHMKEFPLGIIANKWSVLRKFWKDVETETTSARKKFSFPGAHLENDYHTREYWLAVIGEEYGKLCRSNNKLTIAGDERIKEQWRTEGYHRIITTVSLLRRLAEYWDRLDNAEGYKHHLRKSDYSSNADIQEDKTQ